MTSGVFVVSSAMTVTSANGPNWDETNDAERVLLEIRALIESTVTERRKRSAANAFVAVGLNEESILESAEQLIGEAQRYVAVVLPARAPYSQEMQVGLRMLLRNLHESIQVKVICPEEPAARQSLWEGRAAGRTFEVRTARIALQATVIIDGRAALIRSETRSNAYASVVRDAALVRALQNFFTAVWQRIGPSPDYSCFGDQDRADLAQRVLQQLQSGTTDEAAARTLSMSLRTYRRHVSRITDVLGASSRFQAGVLAVQAGLISAEPSKPLGSSPPPMTSASVC